MTAPLQMAPCPWEEGSLPNVPILQGLAAAGGATAPTVTPAPCSAAHSPPASPMLLGDQTSPCQGHARGHKGQPDWVLGVAAPG